MKKLLFLLFSLVYVLTYIVADELPEGVTITETNLFVSTVDNLRIRETPDINGKVIGKIMRFEEVEYQGATSQVEMTLDVDGEQISAPWIKVKTKTGVEGWIWGGFTKRLMELLDSELNLALRLPDNIIIKNSNGSKKEVMFTYEKENIKNIPKNELLGYGQKESAEDMIALKEGKIGHRIDYSNNHTLIKISNNVNGKSFRVLARGDTSSILFLQRLIFYHNETRVMISIEGPVDQIIKENFYRFVIESISESDYIKLISPKLSEFERNVFHKYYKIYNEYGKNRYILERYDESIETVFNAVHIIFKKTKFVPTEDYSVSLYSLVGGLSYAIKSEEISGKLLEWIDASEYIQSSIRFIEK